MNVHSIREFIMLRWSLDDDRATINGQMRGKIRAALEDPRDDIPAEVVFRRLRAYHEGQLRAHPDDA